MFEIELTFSGNEADQGMIDFYDAARALAGFQRSLALTVHLALNGEIITHAPALTGASIFFPAVEQGSWRSKALVVIGGAITFASVGKDSPVGQLSTSLYDYVLSETMGFHADYDKTLQQQYGEMLAAKKITKDKIDSLIEKTENSVADIHRPVVATETAHVGKISKGPGKEDKIGPDLTEFTYEYVKRTIRDPGLTDIVGTISSFNNNTYKGRIFSFEDQRPIPFELMPGTQNRNARGIITNSQHLAGQDKNDPRAVVKLTAHKLVSATSRLKRLHVRSVAVSS